MKMTLSYLYLEAKLDVLEKLGLPQAESLAWLGVAPEDLGCHHLRMDIDQFAGFLDHAAERLEDPLIGLRVGHKFRVATFAQTGSIYSYCKTLEQVIAMNARYQCLAIDAGGISYEAEGDASYMRFATYYEDAERYRQITDIIMGAYCTAYRWLSWSSGEDISALHLAHRAPVDPKAYEDILRLPVVFESDLCGLHIPKTAMTQPLTTHDPEKLMRARAQLEELLGTQDATDTLDAAVEAAIRGAIRNGRVTSQVVADRMGQSWSCLRAALKNTDRGFRERVDHVRRAMFEELYEEGHSFAHIAQALAYNDQAAMNRAFKRWHDMSPTQWEAMRGKDRLSDRADTNA